MTDENDRPMMAGDGINRLWTPPRFVFTWYDGDDVVRRLEDVAYVDFTPTHVVFWGHGGDDESVILLAVLAGSVQSLRQVRADDLEAEPAVTGLFCGHHTITGDLSCDLAPGHTGRHMGGTPRTGWVLSLEVDGTTKQKAAAAEQYGVIL